MTHQKDNILSYIGHAVATFVLTAGLMGLVMAPRLLDERTKKLEAEMEQTRIARFYQPNPSYFAYDEPQLYLAQKSLSSR